MTKNQKTNSNKSVDQIEVNIFDKEISINSDPSPLNTSNKNRNWMKYLPNVPISKIVFPGTHNSHSFKSHYSSFVQNITCKDSFTINQHSNFYTQLNDGIR